MLVWWYRIRNYRLRRSTFVNCDITRMLGVLMIDRGVNMQDHSHIVGHLRVNALSGSRNQATEVWNDPRTLTDSAILKILQRTRKRVQPSLEWGKMNEAGPRRHTRSCGAGLCFLVGMTFMYMFCELPIRHQRHITQIVSWYSCYHLCTTFAYPKYTVNTG